MKNISIIGFGSWGIALACLLHENGHKVCGWEVDKQKADEMNQKRENKAYLPGVIIPKGILITSDMVQATKDADVFVIAVPSVAVRKVALQLFPFVKKGQIVVNVAKGLEENTLLRLSEVISSVLPLAQVVVLSGPSHAEEVSRGIPTTCVASSLNEKASETVQDLFMSPTFRVYTNADLVGVELGGALKNVIALAAGCSDGLGYGDNTKAALMTRGIAEIARLGVAMGANAKTFSGLTGIGDLIVTCTSQHSRNRRAGILLGQGKNLSDTLKEICMVVEGVNTAAAAYALSQKMGVDMPIVTEIYQSLFCGKNPREAVNCLMTRDKKDEHAKEDMSF